MTRLTVKSALLGLALSTAAISLASAAGFGDKSPATKPAVAGTSHATATALQRGDRTLGRTPGTTNANFRRDRDHDRDDMMRNRHNANFRGDRDHDRDDMMRNRHNTSFRGDRDDLRRRGTTHDRDATTAKIPPATSTPVR